MGREENPTKNRKEDPAKALEGKGKSREKEIVGSSRKNLLELEESFLVVEKLTTSRVKVAHGKAMPEQKTP